LVGLEVGQERADAVSFAVGEPGADLAGEAELVTFVDADEEAADLAGEAAFRRGASRRPRTPGEVSP
jgi:hypothetical protein